MVTMPGVASSVALVSLYSSLFNSTTSSSPLFSMKLSDLSRSGLNFLIVSDKMFSTRSDSDSEPESASSKRVSRLWVLFNKWSIKSTTPDICSSLLCSPLKPFNTFKAIRSCGIKSCNVLRSILLITCGALSWELMIVSKSETKDLTPGRISP